MVEVVDKAQAMYQLYGVLKICYLTGDLEENSGKYNVLIAGWEAQKITLRDYPLHGTPYRNRYSCSGVCDTRRPCKKKAKTVPAFLQSRFHHH